MRYILMFAGAFFLLQQAQAALYNADEAPVMYVPVSARSTALGNSLYCAEDEAIRYNPAYLGSMGHGAFNATCGMFQQGTSFGSLALEIKTGDIGWAAGISEIRQSFDKYSGPDSAALGTVSVSQSLGSIASGLKVADGHFLFGTAIRMLTDSIDEKSNSGYSVDAGIGYIFSPILRTGLVVNNAISIANVTDDKPRGKTVLAWAWQPPLHLFGQRSEEENLFSTAVTGTDALPPCVSLGWESIFYGRLAFRVGYDRDYPVAGMGFIFKLMTIDAAAAFKDGGMLYFMTLGWRFGGAVPQQEADIRSAGNDTPERAKSEKAEDTEAVQEAAENVRKQEVLGGQLAQGEEALGQGDYLLAHRMYRAALDADPDNVNAREGLRLMITYMEREMDEHLKAYIKEADEPAEPSVENALALSGSGTFANMVNSLRLLAAQRYHESCVEWRKVQPHEGSAFEKYDAAFAAAMALEFDRLTAGATHLAENSCYAAAVAELNAKLKTPGLSADEVQRIKGVMASYEYVGNVTAKNYIEKAEALCRDGKYQGAAVCLRRALQCGYETERAQRMLEDIRDGKAAEGRTKTPETTPAVAADKTSGRRRHVHVRTSPGLPQPALRNTMSPAIRNKLLREYRLKASEYYLQNRFEECREYLCKILYIDPGDREARRYFDKVDDILKSQAE